MNIPVLESAAISGATELAPKPSRKEMCRLPTRRMALARSHAPDVWLPLAFIVFGLMSFSAALLIIGIRPDILGTYHYNQYVISATHLVVLGWVASVVMGAMYQLVPVALETKLYSQKLARWHLVFHILGVPGMVWMFWVWNVKQAGHFGSFFALGAFVFVYNMARTLRRVPRWTVVATGIASALVWLTATVVAGLFIACAKFWNISPFDPIGQMHAHAHMGVVGFFIMMLVAVSYRLVPMFAISEIQSPGRANLSILLLNVGLAGLVATIALRSSWTFLFACIVIAGFMVHAIELRAILRKRARRSLDLGVRQFLTGLALIPGVGGLGLVICWPLLKPTLFTAQLENVYGVLAILGLISGCILGMLYKIAPFLIWFLAYGDKVGVERVRSVNELYSAGVQRAGVWIFLPGIVITTIGTAFSQALLIRAGILLLGVVVALLWINLFQMGCHLRARGSPIGIKPPSAARQTR